MPVAPTPTPGMSEAAPAAPAAGASYRSVFRPGLFEGRLVWVTGGGSGIGRCVAHELAALGATVLISGRSADKLERVAGEIAEDGGSCLVRPLDIRDEDAVRATVAAVVAEHGPVHGLVNNAGGQFPAPLATIGKRGFEAVLAANLTGGFLMMREVFAQSMSRHGGAIVNMTADFRNGMPGMDTYTGAARALIPTLRNHVPLRRLAAEAEVSAVIVFLLSPAAGFVTGVTVQIDGGASLGNAAFPAPDHARSQPFDGFHRAVTPQVLE